MLRKNHKWLALGAISLGVALIIMDATVVNVSLPVIIRDLGLSVTQAEWINTIYSLMFAALLLTTGKLGDNYGRRRLFLTGMLVFVAGSILAGASNTGSVLIFSRFIQGLGAAMILPATLSSINALYTGKDRAIAFAVWGSTIGGVAAIGPLIGSWLTTDYSWRWAFLINIPVGLLVTAGILMFVPENKDEHADKRIDIAGVLLSSIGFGLIIFALIEAQRYGWVFQSDGSLSPVFYAVVIGVLSIGAFIATQTRNLKQHRTSLIDVRLFSIKSFRYGSIAALIVAAGEFGLLFTLPLLLQNALGYSALGTGWLIVSLAFGTFVISGTTPMLTKKFGSKRVVQSGLLVEAIAVGLLALVISSSIPTWQFAVLLFMYGLGVGMATAQLTSVILAEVPKDKSGQGSGLQSTFRQLGSAFGVAVMGAILISTMATYTQSTLSSSNLPDTVQSTAVAAVKQSAGAVIPVLKENSITQPIGTIAADGLIHASKIALTIASLVLFAGLTATKALSPKKSEPSS